MSTSIGGGGGGNDKLQLQKSLGKLLGFDDGAEDVRDHLLTIQSNEDLSEYLQQLLGGESDGLKKLVDDIGKFHRGERLDETNNEPEAGQQQGQTNQSMVAWSVPARNTTQTTTKSNKTAKTKNQKQVKSRVPPPARKKSPPRTAVSSSPASSVPPQSSENTQSLKNPPPPQQNHQPITAPPSTPEVVVVEKSIPKKGERQNPTCGCFGTKHEPLTNCLMCGRISCVVEGYDYCPFCNFMLEEIKVDGTKTQDKAWIQKERLLRFDREFARRTEIFDDQADYQNTTTWMSEEEREAAQENQRMHLESMKRPKQTLKLDI